MYSKKYSHKIGTGRRISIFTTYQNVKGLIESWSEGYVIILPCPINGIFILTIKELDKELIKKFYDYIKKESKNDILLSDSILIWNKENKTIEVI